MPRARATSLSEKSAAIRRTISASRGVNRESGRLANVSSASSGPVLAWITAPISANHCTAGRPERRDFQSGSAPTRGSDRGVQTEGPIGRARITASAIPAVGGRKKSRTDTGYRLIDSSGTCQLTSPCFWAMNPRATGRASRPTAEVRAPLRPGSPGGNGPSHPVAPGRAGAGRPR